MSCKVFHESDYHSNDGMLTSVWGPSLWHVLHTISFNYPTRPTHKDKERYRTFILSLRHVLPCSYCRKNYQKNLKLSGFNRNVFRNRDTFSRWV